LRSFTGTVRWSSVTVSVCLMLAGLLGAAKQPCCAG
jgi:hypothetical protein